MADNAWEKNCIQAVGFMRKAGKRGWKHGTGGVQGFIEWLAIHEPKTAAALFAHVLPYFINVSGDVPEVASEAEIEAQFKELGRPLNLIGGLCERWGTRPVRTIDGHDIWAVVDETRLRGAPGLPRRSDGPTDGMARAMLAALSTVFTWLARRRIVATNPCIGIQRPDAAPTGFTNEGAGGGRKRYLSDGHWTSVLAVCFGYLAHGDNRNARQCGSVCRAYRPSAEESAR